MLRSSVETEGAKNAGPHFFLSLWNHFANLDPHSIRFFEPVFAAFVHIYTHLQPYSILRIIQVITLNINNFPEYDLYILLFY